MNPTAFSFLKSAGAVLFLATMLIGWQLATPAISPAARDSASLPAVRRSARQTKLPRSVAADAASQRMSVIRSITDPQERMLATIALANSLSPSEFAAWGEGEWFTLRGGPELLLFSRILQERWLREDPEGLLEWAMKRKNGVANSVMEKWAEQEPQRLLTFFKTHRNDGMELEALAVIAKNSPDLALQRLREMNTAGITADQGDGSLKLMAVFAKKSPDALKAMLDSLKPTLKLRAEVALCWRQLDTTFSEEIRRLWERPDGWKIYSETVGWGDNFSTKLLENLSGMPPEWRSHLAMDPSSLVKGENAERCWNMDLAGAGFSAWAIKKIRGQALEETASARPELVVQHLAELDLGGYQRTSILKNAFSKGDPEKLRGLISQLPTEEDRQAATRILDERTAPKDDTKPKTPEDLLARLSIKNLSDSKVIEYLREIKNWDPQAIFALSAGFEKLPAEQKQQIAIASSDQFSRETGKLKGQAIRYLLENPPLKETEANWNSVSAQSSRYAVNLSAKDPDAAVAWVCSLPPGKDKAWTQKNLFNNWKQYDPKAAEQWQKSLPSAEREAIEKLKSP